ncbi:MAG: hypothetical protein AAF735_04275 [Myxococcota bacterium]
MGVLSPYLKTLALKEHGLEWVFPGASVAHPLDEEPAVMLYRDVERTAEQLGIDVNTYRPLLRPFIEPVPELIEDALAPPKNNNQRLASIVLDA